MAADLAGSVIGGVIASLLGIGGTFDLNFLGCIVAVIATVCSSALPKAWEDAE